MSHYHITISIDKTDVKAIREQFDDYMEKCGSLSIAVVADREVEISPELANAIRSLFVRLLTTVAAGKFEGLN